MAKERELIPGLVNWPVAFPRSGLNEVTAADAGNSLRRGEVAAFRSYLQEFQQNLKTIAELFDPISPDQPVLAFNMPPTRSSPLTEDKREEWIEREEWIGTTSQLLDAIKRKEPTAIGSYLRYAADLISLVDKILDEDKHSGQEWQLKIQRRRRGAPRQSAAEFIGRSNIATRVRFALRRYGKLEAAVAEVMEHTGLSRSTVMKAYSPVKVKSPPKKRK